MNDETKLLEIGRQETEPTKDEVVMAYREAKAKKVAASLVAEMFKTTGRKDFFGYWKRIAHAEEQAIIATRFLDEQALDAGDPRLCVHWVRVRIAIRDRTYQ